MRIKGILLSEFTHFFFQNNLIPIAKDTAKQIANVIPHSIELRSFRQIQVFLTVMNFLCLGAILKLLLSITLIYIIIIS